MVFRISILMIVLMVSCAKDSQNPEADANFRLAVGDTDCLTGSASKLQNVFIGAGTAGDVHAVAVCAAKIVQVFMQYTKGASPDGYTAAELKGFLVKYYVPSGISDDAINSILKLKRAMVGGTGDFITRVEIQRLIETVGVLDLAGQDLVPAAKILFTDAYLEATEAEFFHAHQVLDGALDRISSVLVKSGQDYSFSDLGALLYSWGEQLNMPLFLKMADFVPVLESGKAVLVSGAANSIRSDEWQPLLLALSSVYTDFRMLQRLIPKVNALEMMSDSRLSSFFGRTIDLLEMAVGRRANKQIALSEIHDFLFTLQSQKILPSSITADQATTLGRFFLCKLFYLHGAPADSLNDGTISELRRFLKNWNQYDTALVNQDFSNVADFDLAYRPSGLALTFDDQGRLELPRVHAPGVRHELSAVFAFLEWIGAKWGDWPISQPVLDTVVSDFLDVLHSCNLLVDTNISFSSKFMRYANLFVLSSNGDLKLDKAEAFQYVVYVLSAYRAQRQLNALSGACNGGSDCISSILFQNRATLLSNVPNLLMWLGSDSARWTGFNQDLGKAVGADQWLEQLVEIHYIETFMLRFDLNKDQLIDLNESMAAFPIFHPMLSDLLPKNGLNESDTEPIYTFLLKYGTLPTNVSYGSLVYIYWKMFPSTWVYSSDRKIISGILASL